jgi:hypothetical protein
MQFFETNLEKLARARVARFFLVHVTKTGKNVGTKRTRNVPNGRKISQMCAKYINIFQSKALQNLPKLEFLV